MDVIDLHTMKREEGISSPLSVALGNFDGVHIGHAELIRRTLEYAKKNGIKSAVWTFADAESALPNKPGTLSLTTTDEKLSLITKLGVDYAILADFESVRNLSPEEFVSDILIKKCRAEAAVCGFNFRFGKGGAGDAMTLQKLMAERECIVVDPVHARGGLVSSSAIRQIIESGDMEATAEMLGRPFSVTLPVTVGKRLGRRIGIPTINQNFPDGHIIPATGIYACTVKTPDGTYLGAANVGFRPTVESGVNRANCETHIIGYDGCLYGKNLKVSFYKRLRGEEKFPSLDELKAQIQADIEETKNYFITKEKL